MNEIPIVKNGLKSIGFKDGDITEIVNEESPKKAMAAFLQIGDEAEERFMDDGDSTVVFITFAGHGATYDNRATSLMNAST